MRMDVLDVLGTQLGLGAAAAVAVAVAVATTTATRKRKNYSRHTKTQKHRKLMAFIMGTSCGPDACIFETAPTTRKPEEDDSIVHIPHAHEMRTPRLRDSDNAIRQQVKICTHTNFATPTRGNFSDKFLVSEILF